MIEHESYIISQLQQGNDSAYRYLFDHYYVRLCRVAQYYVKDVFVAENIVGDLIFYLWERKETLEIRTSLSSYLFTSVRNRCINHLHQASTSREIRMPLNTDDTSAIDLPLNENSPLGVIIEKELDSQINESIAALPNECRTIFKMSRYDQLTYEEIAQHLGISIDTVRYHMKNALTTLRKNLKEYLSIFF
jgi:RNA polymerase sigma-70 factor, ECF subfamily